MIYVTIDLSADHEDWHLPTLDRLIKGIKGLENSGYKVERYGEFEDRPSQKWILSIGKD